MHGNDEEVQIETNDRGVSTKISTVPIDGFTFCDGVGAYVGR